MINPLNAELNPIRHLLALLGGATIVVVSRLRVNCIFLCFVLFSVLFVSIVLFYVLFVFKCVLLPPGGCQSNCS
jgi:hypothetical protein